MNKLVKDYCQLVFDGNGCGRMMQWDDTDEVIEELQNIINLIQQNKIYVLDENCGCVLKFIKVKEK